MNLGWRDVRHQWARFVATGVGLGLLFAIVLAMGGIYRGMVEDATALVRRMDADFWIVQHGTRGPFAERSVVPETIEVRARAVPGVAWARSFSSVTVEPEHADRRIRMTLAGLAWPEERGDELPLIRGRSFAVSHREIIVDQSLGLELGSAIRLGGEDYRVVGIGRGLVSSSGDALGFVTMADITRIQSYLAPEALRTSLRAGVVTDPGVSAVIVKAAPGASLEALRDRLEGFRDVEVFTRAEQESLLLDGVIDKARRQIGLFRALLSVVSGIVVSLVIFNMTSAKTREIALLKLMGARLELIVKMIVQQSLLLTLLAYAVALGVAQLAFEHFPRRVVVGQRELLGVLALAVAIALFASLAAIRRAIRIPPTTILAS